MSRDDEIMALVNQTAGHHWMDEAHIQRFAALVAAAEREACAKVCEDFLTRSRSPLGRAVGDAIRARSQQ